MHWNNIQGLDVIQQSGWYSSDVINKDIKISSWTANWLLFRFRFFDKACIRIHIYTIKKWSILYTNIIIKKSGLLTESDVSMQVIISF